MTVSSYKMKKAKAKLALIHNYECQYCGVVCSGINAQIDHLIPTSKGGEDELSNYVYSCRSCNASKRDRDLEEFRFLVSFKLTPFYPTINYIQYRNLMIKGLVDEIELITFHFEK